MSKYKGPIFPNLDPYIAAGLDPNTGRFAAMNKKASSGLKNAIKILLRDIDEQDAVNRYVWYNLPMNLTSQELERMIYFKGQLAFFYDSTTEQFYFTPYALNGTIDWYGRFNTISPVPMTSGTDEDKHINRPLSDILTNKKLRVIYGQKLPEELTEDDLMNSAVLLHDYSKQLSQTILPRQQIQDPLLDVMAECIPYLRTSLIAGSGIKGMRVPEGAENAVDDASRGLVNAALNGEPWVALTGSQEFQELTDGSALKSEEFMLAMQSLDNFRLSTYGIDNGGLFEKKAHELQSEADLNGGPVGLVLQDGLSIRQNFCNIVNSIWGIGIWCEPAQNIMGMDNDGDGAIDEDNSDGANTGMENDGGSEDD